MTDIGVRWLGMAALPFVVGCNLLTPLIFIGEHKKTVSPEFDKLARSRVVILVWTDQATLFDYPHARIELATYVGDKLYSEMAQRNLGTEIVDPRDVEDFLQKNVAAQVDAELVGRHFQADDVIWVEVYKFQVRDPLQPQFLRGEIQASLAVYDLRSDADAVTRYELTPIDCVYPEGPPLLLTATNSPLVRESMYRKFAEQISRKFYEYTVDL